MQAVVTVAGIVLCPVVTAGWEHTKLVYHLSDSSRPRQATICGRIRSAHARPSDDDPRALCANCRSSLHGRLERGPLADVPRDAPAWRAVWAELEAYEKVFVRPRPKWVRVEMGQVVEGHSRRGTWRSLLRQGATPDDPDFKVGPVRCADLVVAGSAEHFRVSVRWIVPQAELPVTSCWVELYVRSPGDSEDTWFESTPRHDPIKAAVAALVAGVELP